MDNKPASGHRIHFRKINPATSPFLIVGAGVRQTILIVNEDSTNAIRVGASGTVSTLGTLIPAGQSLADNYSQDEYWAYAPSSSGTVSGFIVV
jgi:hypothetical protein